MRYFWIGLKNAFSDDVKSLKKEFHVRELWDISQKLNRKFEHINEQTRQKIHKDLQYR